MDRKKIECGSIINDEKLRTKTELMATIRKRLLGFLGHLLRGAEIENDCLMSTVEGTRSRGRQIRKFMDRIKEWTGCGSIGEVMRPAEDRARWRSIPANVKDDPALR